MAPFRDFQVLWGNLMAARVIENHYCPRCRRTRKFRRGNRLMCLTCGKCLEFRRRESA